ncbi:MAG: hypothetical protein AAF311_10630 [Pseudomonadota bacterium]
MKRLMICAMAGALVACGGGGGDVTAENAASVSPMRLADAIVSDMREAADVVNGIQTVSDAEAAKPVLADIGGRYEAQMSAMRNLDQSRIKDPEAFMGKQMESADALAGFMNAMSELQKRNVEAAQTIMPELQAFRPG